MVIASSSSFEGTVGCNDEEILFVVAAAAALFSREHWARSRARTLVLMGIGGMWGMIRRLLCRLMVVLELVLESSGAMVHVHVLVKRAIAEG